MVSSNPVAFFFNTCQQRSNLFDWFLLEFIMIHEQCGTFQKGMKSFLGLDTTETSESWTKIISKMFVSSVIRALAYPHWILCRNPQCLYSPWLLLETGQTFIACVLIPLLKVWTFGLLSGPYHTALYGDWLHCNPVQGRKGNKQGKNVNRELFCNVGRPSIANHYTELRGAEQRGDQMVGL